MKSEKENRLTEVYAGSTIQENMVKNLLENADIDAFLMDDLIGTLNPWHATAGGVGAVKVFVSNLDYEKAKKVVGEYENNLKEYKE